MINCIFAYYAAIGAMTSGDVRFISLNSFTQFAIDFAIVDKKSKFLKQSDLDTLFIAIDSIAARVQCVARVHVPRIPFGSIPAGGPLRRSQKPKPSP